MKVSETMLFGPDRDPRELHVDSAVAGLDGNFVAETTVANGTPIHYVRGGHGPTLLLLHGFPQDWFEWRRVMPRLSKQFTVVALDLPGVGGSGTSVNGYAAADLAEDIHEFLDRLQLGPAHVVGHDIGGCVAYAFAREFPQSASTVTVLEVPIPGIEPRHDLDVEDPMWHVEFHMTPDLPEALVAGRQSIYFRYFFNQFTKDNAVISDADVEHYAKAYGDLSQLRSAFEFYRAMPANISYNVQQTRPIDLPLLLVGGEHLFGPALEKRAENLQANYGWSNVDVHVVNDAKHYLVEEQPNAVAELIERHTMAQGSRAPAAAPSPHCPRRRGARERAVPVDTLDRTERARRPSRTSSNGRNGINRKSQQAIRTGCCSRPVGDRPNARHGDRAPRLSRHAAAHQPVDEPGAANSHWQCCPR